MKSPFITPPTGRRLLASFAILTLATIPTLHAEKGDRERLDIKAALLPTANAPAGAIGKAELRADDWNGTAKALLKIGTKGLAPATYTINVLVKSTTTTVSLGTLVVPGTPTLSGSTSLTGTDSLVSSNPRFGVHPKVIEAAKEQTVIIGSKAQPFPDGFDPFDIGGISVADPNAVMILNADLANPLSEQFTLLTAVQSIDPGVAAPNAQGKLTIAAKRQKGVEKAVITLFVRKVPANLPFTVNVNGANVAQGTSTKNGQIRLGQTPGKHKGFAGFGQQISGLDLQSITVTTLSGDLLFSVTR